MTSHSFPKTARLLTAPQFEKVLKEGKKIHTPLATIFYRPSARSRLGIIVGRRAVAKASDRNCIKRVIREWFRKNGSTLPCLDYIVMVKAKAVAMKKQEMNQMLEKVISKLR